MKKSKEQIIKELGCDQPGYWFRSKDQKTKFYWSSKENVKTLEEKIICHHNVGCSMDSWRRSQTDWKSIKDLVIYDRFGSKITYTEYPEYSIEIKLTDIGQQHWNAFTHYRLIDSFCYIQKIFDQWGGMKTLDKTKKELERLYQLFPANEDI
jgi:hypothetical protein